MLRTRRDLAFPVLVRVGESHLKNETTGKSKEVDIYCLDWSPVQKRGWQLNCLPRNYSDVVDDLEFAITDSYLTQIRKSATEAVDSWSGQYPFDTMIRYICMQPATEHAWVAFRLLEDCLYDRDTQWHSRAESRHFMCEAMLLRLWWNQTGRGLVWDKSKMNKLEERVKGIKESEKKDSHILEERFVEKTSEHHKKTVEILDEFYSSGRSGDVACRPNDKMLQVPTEFKWDTDYPRLIEKKRIIYAAEHHRNTTGATISSEANLGLYTREIAFNDGAVFTTEEKATKANLKCDTSLKLTAGQIIAQLIKTPTMGFKYHNALHDEGMFIDDGKTRYMIDNINQVISLKAFGGCVLHIAGDKYVL